MLWLAGAWCMIPMWAASLSATATQPIQAEATAQQPRSDLELEFQVRRFSLDPEGTQSIWQPMLRSNDWLQRFDVLDAMQRSPEAARWFCVHQKDELRNALAHERSAVRAISWRIVRMGQGLGSDCVDWAVSVGDRGSLGDEGQAWFEAALSEATIVGGDSRIAAFGAALDELAGRNSSVQRDQITRSVAFIAQVGNNQIEGAADLWWHEVNGKAVFRGVLANDLRIPISDSMVQALRERASSESIGARFQVEALALAQFAIAGQPEGGADSIDWEVVLHGVTSWPTEANVQPAEQSQRMELLDEVSLLGIPRLGRMFWQVAMDVQNNLEAVSLAELGGVEGARFVYLTWASNSATPVVSLTQIFGKGSALQEEVWATLEGDSRNYPLKALELFLRGSPSEEVQRYAVTKLWAAPESDERRDLLLQAIGTSQGEALRLAFRVLAKEKNPAIVQEALHRVWKQRNVKERSELLREMPNSGAWVAFAEDWLESVREFGPSDLLELEHLSYLAIDARWQALFERDFEEAFHDRRVDWEAGNEPVSRDLARRATALYRVQNAGGATGVCELDDNVLIRSLTWRAHWLSTLSPERIDPMRFDFSKACIALFAKDPRFDAWVLAHVEEIETWPRRLQVEIGLGLHPASYAGLNNELSKYVGSVQSEFYAQLGSVLKERWLSEGFRAAGLFPSEAANRRAKSSVRQAAMIGLAKEGQERVLFDILNQDTGVTGPQLAMEALQPLESDEASAVLRARWMRAKDAARAGKASAEIEGHLELELFLVLVKRRALSPEEIGQSLAGPMAKRFAQLGQRMEGEVTDEGWRPQLHVVHQLAKQGELHPLLMGHPDWSALDGRFLGKLAQSAWDAGDAESCNILARWAEVALAGEPNTNRWWGPALGVRILRYRLARKGGDLANTAWYAERLLQDLLDDWRESMPVDGMLGGHDLREGRHPIAFLSALRLQSLAMLAAKKGDGLRSALLLYQARGYCGVSTRAQDQQVRAKRWIATR